jgi:hypothetical protein
MAGKKKGDQRNYSQLVPIINMVLNLVRIFEDWHK